MSYYSTRLWKSKTWRAQCIVVYANRLIDIYRISMQKSVLFTSLPSTTTNNNNKKLKKATKAEIPKVNMNKPVVKTQIYNIFFPDLQSLTYDVE